MLWYDAVIYLQNIPKTASRPWPDPDIVILTQMQWNLKQKEILQQNALNIFHLQNGRSTK